MYIRSIYTAKYRNRPTGWIIPRPEYRRGGFSRPASISILPPSIRAVGRYSDSQLPAVRVFDLVPRYSDGGESPGKFAGRGKMGGFAAILPSRLCAFFRLLCQELGGLVQCGISRVEYDGL